MHNEPLTNEMREDMITECDEWFGGSHAGLNDGALLEQWSSGPPKAFYSDAERELPCRCGHAFERHFDPCEGDAHVGCKHCQCSRFNPDDGSGDSAEGLAEDDPLVTVPRSSIKARNEKEMAHILSARQNADELSKVAEKTRRERNLMADEADDVASILDDVADGKVEIKGNRVQVICGVTARPIGFVDAALVLDILESDRRFKPGDQDSNPSFGGEFVLLYNPAYEVDEVLEIEVDSAAEWYRHIDRNVMNDLIDADDPKRRCRGVSYMRDGRKTWIYIKMQKYTETHPYADPEVRQNALMMRDEGVGFTQGIVNYFRAKNGLDESTHADEVFGDHVDLESGDVEERAQSMQDEVVRLLRDASGLSIARRVIDDFCAGLDDYFGDGFVTIQDEDGKDEGLCRRISAPSGCVIFRVVMPPSGFPVRVEVFGRADDAISCPTVEKLDEALKEILRREGMIENLQRQTATQ